jgi:predicted nucleic acid-binding protein
LNTKEKDKKIIVYLDNCTFNRPFDDQQRIDIKLESEAKIYIQDKIRIGKIELVWSYILEFENAQNPFAIRKHTIYQWKKRALQTMVENNQIIERATQFEQMGLKSKDALHIACAVEAKAEYFITTDKTILKKLGKNLQISIINPVNFLMELEERQ